MPIAPGAGRQRHRRAVALLDAHRRLSAARRTREPVIDVRDGVAGDGLGGPMPGGIVRVAPRSCAGRGYRVQPVVTGRDAVAVRRPAPGVRRAVAVGIVTEDVVAGTRRHPRQPGQGIVGEPLRQRRISRVGDPGDHIAGVPGIAQVLR